MNQQSITKVTDAEWEEAQKYEMNTWVINNKRNSIPKLVLKYLRLLKNPPLFIEHIKFKDFYCGDDWNYWWMKNFDYYKALPDKINNALEVGSGPYSNIRLINKLKKIENIFCTDPLMDVYKNFKMTWVSEMSRKGKIKALKGRCEDIEYEDNTFDLVVCNNVLDHVKDSEKCFSEMYRVLKTGGYFVFSQDLTDEDEIKRQPKREGHPIRLNHTFLEATLKDKYTESYKRILPKEESRSDEFYGTFLFIGIKK